MRYITEQELRELFSEGLPQSYSIPQGARLTPAASQYLSDLRLYPPQESQQNQTLKPSGKKPEYMTHLNATEMVHKGHPRIALRGKLDSLEADIMLAEISALTAGGQNFIAQLEEVLTLTRRILGSEVSGKPLGDWTLGGMTAEQIHEASHQPQNFGFIGHVLPSAGQGLMPALFNRLRTQVRETELAMAAAFCQGNNSCDREDLLLALNRLSSYFYVLQLRAIKAQG